MKQNYPKIDTTNMNEIKKAVSPSDLLSRGVIASLRGMDLSVFLEDLDGLGDLFTLNPQSLGYLTGAHRLPGVLHGLKNRFSLFTHRITLINV